MNKLKPCPFCGGEAVVEQIPGATWDKFVAHCKSSKCIAFYIGYIDEGIYETRTKAIEAWNRRARETDNEIIKVFDILDKFEFFGGQRAGRELWFDKPTDIQNEDIGDFLRDLDFLKQFINRQKAEIERLHSEVKEKTETIVFLKDQATGWSIDFCNLKAKLNTAKAGAIKEFAERLKSTPLRFRVENTIHWDEPPISKMVLFIDDTDIDNLVKEITEGNYER